MIYLGASAIIGARGRRGKLLSMIHETKKNAEAAAGKERKHFLHNGIHTHRWQESIDKAVKCAYVELPWWGISSWEFPSLPADRFEEAKKNPAQTRSETQPP